MKRASSPIRLAVVAFATAFVTHQAAVADPPDILRNYRFIPSHSTVNVTGGFAGFDWDLAIAGRFGLVTGYDYTVSPTTHVPMIVPFAKFVDVDAILYNPLSMAPMPVPGWDLDQTLNLTGLQGIVQSPHRINFRGEEGQGFPIELQASIKGRLLFLTGANEPGCCDFFKYEVKALAHLAPHADFNLDGLVNRGDKNLLLANIGLTANATFEQGDADGDGDVDGEDFLTWQRQIGAATNLNEFTDAGSGAGTVPEPATLALVLVEILMLPTWFRRRNAS